MQTICKCVPGILVQVYDAETWDVIRQEFWPKLLETVFKYGGIDGVVVPPAIEAQAQKVLDAPMGPFLPVAAGQPWCFDIDDIINSPEDCGRDDCRECLQRELPVGGEESSDITDSSTGCRCIVSECDPSCECLPRNLERLVPNTGREDYTPCDDLNCATCSRCQGAVVVPENKDYTVCDYMCTSCSQRDDYRCSGFFTADSPCDVMDCNSCARQTDCHFLVEKEQKDD